MEMSTPKPKRCVELTIQIGADTLKDAVAALSHIMYEFDRPDHPLRDMVSGSPSSNFLTHVEVRPAQTHEEYFRQLDEYLKAKKSGQA